MLGAHKLHFVTVGSTADKTPAFHDPPLIFNVETDPGETYPLNAKSAEYKLARTRLEAAAQAHEASVLPVLDHSKHSVA